MEWPDTEEIPVQKLYCGRGHYNETCTPGHVEGLLHESLVNWCSLSHRFDNDYLSVFSRSQGEIFDSSNSLKIFVRVSSLSFQAKSRKPLAGSKKVPKKG